MPHVSCDFWIEGFKLGDDTGWIVFYGWPPTGDKSVVTPTGAGLDWTADSGSVSGEFHFLQGPFQLPAGHYRVEIFTDDGHPGGGGHFAKSKTFWVEDCESPVENPPCPLTLEVEARSLGGRPDNFLDWTSVEGAVGYNVYRAVDGGDFEFQVTIDAPYTSYVDDHDIEPGVTYEYYVTAVIGNTESENCEIVEVTAIPFFPTLAVGALAVAGSLGAYVWLRRKA